MKALAVFTDSNEHPLSFLLRRGFRHVFVCLLSGEHWIRVDAMAGVPEVGFVTGADFDLAGFYREKGYRVVEVEQGPRPSRSPLMWNNCVGLARMVLGVRAPLAVTPYRLYRSLTRTRR